MTYEASKIRVLVLRGRKILFPTRERSRRLLFRMDLKDKDKVISKDQNIGKHGYIGNWILRKYQKYRKYRWIFLQNIGSIKIFYILII